MPAAETAEQDKPDEQLDYHIGQRWPSSEMHQSRLSGTHTPAALSPRRVGAGQGGTDQQPFLPHKQRPPLPSNGLTAMEEQHKALLPTLLLSPFPTLCSLHLGEHTPYSTCAHPGIQRAPAVWG